MAIVQQLTDLVGNTPIIKLNRLVPDEAANVYVKLEAFNPGASVKDRAARQMIETAERQGLLKAGQTIVEPTSGNTGIALSWIGAVKGYPVIIVMPESMSLERRKLIQAYGATLVLTPASEGMKGAIKKAEELVNELGAFMPQQFQNPANPEAHTQTTALEILADFGSDGLDAFVAGVGTGGTITGVSKVLKEANPAIQVFAAEADESAVLSGQEPAPHSIQGISAGFIPHVLNTQSYDGIIRVPSAKALETARLAATNEGLLVGISSGAAIWSAIEVAKKLGKGKSVLTILADSGERYLSTALHNVD